MANVDKTGLGNRIVPINQGERAAGRVEARKFLYSDFSSSGDVVQLIDVPANSYVARLWVKVTTAFDGTSPVLIVGDGDDPNGYLAAGEIEETAVSVNPMDAADVAAAYAVKVARPFYTSADTIDITFTYSGTPTTGEAVLIVEIVEIP